MLLTAKATFFVSSLGTAHRLGEYARHYCGYCSVALFCLYASRAFDKNNENEDVSFDVVAAADASGNAKRQLIISRYFA